MEMKKTANVHLLKENENLLGSNVADIAEALEKMSGAEAVKYFRMLPKDTAAEVFAYLAHDTQQEIVETITDCEISRIMDDLFLDDAVDFVEEMPANVVKRVLASVSPERREIINQFLNYPEGSAGSLMTIEYVALRKCFTVKQAFEHIRATGINKETIYTCYVIDNERKLLGTVSARTLMLSDADEIIGDVMETNLISAVTAEDQESLVNDFRKYDLLAIPVVDTENRLVGIVTVDDIMEIQAEETTEDFEIMAAMSPSETPYLKTSVWKLTKNRLVWLLILMFSATITGAIISSFEEALAVLPGLIAFIPMLMDTGGNSGSQSSTLIIRGMALEEITLADVGLVLWKELRVAFICGVVLAAVNYFWVIIRGYDAMMSLTVSVALFATVMMAKAVGCLLPMAAKKLGLDPAVMASPVITTIVDSGSLLVYFALATLILHI